MMAVQDPLEKEHYIMTYFEIFFLVFYTLEMIVKIMAMGLICTPFTYLRDPWNIMDFIVVTLSWIFQFLTDQNVSVIRSVRLLRALRTISSVPSMSGLVKTLI